MTPRTTNPIIHLLLLTAWLLTAVSCTMEQSDNGHLDGFWQLTSVDTLKTGIHTDMREQRIFWSVEFHLLQVHDVAGKFVPVIFRFETAHSQLILRDPYIDNRETGDPAVDDAVLLIPYGITAPADTFDILRLTSSHLTLQNKALRLAFRKY